MLNNARPRDQAEFVEAAPEPGSSPVAESGARRVFSRFGVDLDVTVTSEHNFYAGFVENMSVGGVFIATHQLKPVGERIEFAIHLPDRQEPIRGVGQVRWIRVYSDASDVPPGMGIQFDPLDADARHGIEAFLSQREPLFFDDA